MVYNRAIQRGAEKYSAERRRALDPFTVRIMPDRDLYGFFDAFFVYKGRFLL